jgi:hypothetical protein
MDTNMRVGDKVAVYDKKGKIRLFEGTIREKGTPYKFGKKLIKPLRIDNRWVDPSIYKIKKVNNPVGHRGGRTTRSRSTIRGQGSNMARRRKGRARVVYRTKRVVSRAKKSFMGFSIPPVAKKMAAGIGMGVLAGAIVSYVAPQYKEPAKLIGAFAGGDVFGVIGQVLFGGGLNLQGILPGTATPMAADPNMVG